MSLRLASTMALIVLTALPARADHGLGSPTDPYHWRRTGWAVVVRVIDSTEQAYRDDGIVARLLDRVEHPFDRLAILYVLGASDPAIRTSCPWPGQYAVRVCSGTYTGDHPAAGHWGDIDLDLEAGHIRRARVWLNDAYLTTESLRRWIGCMEILHTLGLDHRGDPTDVLGDHTYYPRGGGTANQSCMEYDGDQWPDAGDLDQLARMYDHVH